jgi:V-type H+-transporting ATPase subunit C
MSTYWIVATGCPKGGSSKDALFSDLKNRTSSLCELGEAPVKFDVPDGESALKFGSFDDLIRMTDELAKYDAQVEGIARRLERMYLELEPSKANDPASEFKILSQTKSMSFDKYLREWRWDDAKYPKMRGLSNNVTLLLSVANKLDEEARNKSSQYNELKTAHNNMTKKETGSILSRDLTDVLTPEVVKEDDFITSEHLTTIVVILPQSNVEGFLKNYERYAENVVPQSARQFSSVTQEDGTQIWRVVMFRNAVDAFMKKAREDRLGTCRQFEYSSQAYDKVRHQREELKKELDRQDKMMKGFCKASFSDVMIAWVHVKAMRTFVESVLRFGVPPNFASFIVRPKGNQQVAVRKALAEVLGKSSAATDKMADAAGDDEEYFPYVSLSFIPFTAQKGF